MGKAEIASRVHKTESLLAVSTADSGAADSGESRDGGTRAISFAAVLLGTVLVLNGCAMRKPQEIRITAALVMERACMVSVALTERTECTGPDLDHLRCTGLMLTSKTGCEKVRARP